MGLVNSKSHHHHRHNRTGVVAHVDTGQIELNLNKYGSIFEADRGDSLNASLKIWFGDKLSEQTIIYIENYIVRQHLDDLIDYTAILKSKHQSDTQIVTKKLTTRMITQDGLAVTSCRMIKLEFCMHFAGLVKKIQNSHIGIGQLFLDTFDYLMQADMINIDTLFDSPFASVDTDGPELHGWNGTLDADSSHELIKPDTDFSQKSDNNFTDFSQINDNSINDFSQKTENHEANPLIDENIDIIVSDPNKENHSINLNDLNKEIHIINSNDPNKEIHIINSNDPNKEIHIINSNDPTINESSTATFVSMVEVTSDYIENNKKINATSYNKFIDNNVENNKNNKISDDINFTKFTIGSENRSEKQIEYEPMTSFDAPLLPKTTTTPKMQTPIEISPLTQSQNKKRKNTLTKNKTLAHIASVISIYSQKEDYTKAQLFFAVQNLLELIWRFIPQLDVSEVRFIKALVDTCFDNDLGHLHQSMDSVNRIMPRLSQLAIKCFDIVLLNRGSRDELENKIPVLMEHNGRHPWVYSVVSFLSMILPDFYTSVPKAAPGPLDTITSEDNPNKQADNKTNFWAVLYDSNKHGKSINRMKNNCFNYKSPTIVLIELEQDNRMIVIGVDQEWRDEGKNWGGSHCFITQIFPTYEEIEHGPLILYFKENSRNLFTGLRVGQNSASSTNPILTVDKELINAQYTHKCFVKCRVKSFIVLGCNSKHSLQDMQKYKNWMANQKEKWKKIDTKTSWIDNPDREILELGGISASQGIEFYKDNKEPKKN